MPASTTFDRCINWFFYVMLMLNIVCWSIVGWHKLEVWRFSNSLDEMKERLQYWTEQTECDVLFEPASLNSNACRDRVADLHGRTEEYKKEKEESKKYVDQLMKEAGIQPGVP